MYIYVWLRPQIHALHRKEMGENKSIEINQVKIWMGSLT